MKIEDWEMETLADKFDVDRDGLINPSEFLAFMHSLEDEEKKDARMPKKVLVTWPYPQIKLVKLPKPKNV